MKKTLILAPMVFGIGLLLLSGSALATDYAATVTPGAGINGTAHDLRPGQPAAVYNPRDIDNQYDGGAGGDLNRICVWCHAPHHTLKPAEYAGEIDYLPLWNHTVTSMDFQPYTNGADEPADASHMSTAEALANQPGGVSKLCLSCHDGSVAVNEYGFAPGDIKSSGVRKGDAPATITAEYRIGEAGNLTNHHPIGFKYMDVATVDDEIASPTVEMGNYEIGDLLWQGRMECTTCHDVHNTKNTGEKFLWISDENSNFCLTCHLKGDKT
jgi:predicted CXXCH cytochrome family protein